MKHLTIVLMTTVLFASCSSSDSVSEPKTYDECILKYVKSGMTKGATIAVQRSCKKQFPDSVSVDSARDLTVEELQQITGTFKPGYSDNVFDGNLYNGNRAIRVTRLEIQVTYLQQGKDQTRNFFLNSDIPPMSTNSYVTLKTSSEITKENMKAWRFVSGRGRTED